MIPSGVSHREHVILTPRVCFTDERAECRIPIGAALPGHAVTEIVGYIVHVDPGPVGATAVGGVRRPRLGQDRWHVRVVVLRCHGRLWRPSVFKIGPGVRTWCPEVFFRWVLHKTSGGFRSHRNFSSGGLGTHRNFPSGGSVLPIVTHRNFPSGGPLLRQHHRRVRPVHRDRHRIHVSERRMSRPRPSLGTLHPPFSPQRLENVLHPTSGHARVDSKSFIARMRVRAVVVSVRK